MIRHRRAVSGGIRPTRRGAIVCYTLAFVVTVLAALTPFTHPAADRLPDLLVYRGSVEGLAQRGTLYAFHRSNGDPFTYPPLAGLLLYPLRFLPVLADQVIWTIGTLFAMWQIVRLVAGKVTVRIVPPLIAVAVAGCLMTAPLRSNLRFGQVTVFLVLAVVADHLLDKPPWPRGLLTGLAAAVKLTPIVFIPYLWLSGRRRAAVIASVTAIGGTVGAWLLLPTDSAFYWFHGAEDARRVGDISLSGNRSVLGIALRSGLRGNVAAVVLIALLAVLTAVAYWRAHRAARANSELSALAIIGCLGVAVSPVSWTHHAIWLLLIPVALLNTSGRSSTPRSLLALLSVLTLLSSPGQAAHLVEPFHLLLREALGLMAVLAILALPGVQNAEPSPRPRPGLRPLVDYRGSSVGATHRDCPNSTA